MAKKGRVSGLIGFGEGEGLSSSELSAGGGDSGGGGGGTSPSPGTSEFFKLPESKQREIIAKTEQERQQQQLVESGEGFLVDPKTGELAFQGTEKFERLATAPKTKEEIILSREVERAGFDPVTGEVLPFEGPLSIAELERQSIEREQVQEALLRKGILEATGEPEILQQAPRLDVPRAFRPRGIVTPGTQTVGEDFERFLEFQLKNAERSAEQEMKAAEDLLEIVALGGAVGVGVKGLRVASTLGGRFKRGRRFAEGVEFAGAAAFATGVGVEAGAIIDPIDIDKAFGIEAIKIENEFKTKTDKFLAVAELGSEAILFGAGAVAGFKGASAIGKARSRVRTGREALREARFETQKRDIGLRPEVTIREQIKLARNRIEEVPKTITEAIKLSEAFAERAIPEAISIAPTTKFKPRLIKMGKVGKKKDASVQIFEELAGIEVQQRKVYDNTLEEFRIFDVGKTGRRRTKTRFEKIEETINNKLFREERVIQEITGDVEGKFSFPISKRKRVRGKRGFIKEEAAEVAPGRGASESVTKSLRKAELENQRSINKFNKHILRITEPRGRAKLKTPQTRTTSQLKKFQTIVDRQQVQQEMSDKRFTQNNLKLLDEINRNQEREMRGIIADIQQQEKQRTKPIVIPKFKPKTKKRRRVAFRPKRRVPKPKPPKALIAIPKRAKGKPKRKKKKAKRKFKRKFRPSLIGIEADILETDKFIEDRVQTGLGVRGRRR